MKNYIFLLLALLIVCASCKQSPVDKVDPQVEAEEQSRANFLLCDEPCVYLIGGKVVKYDMDNEQICYSEDFSFYCVSDETFENQYSLTIQGQIKEGAVLSVDIDCNGYSELESETAVSMEVLKVNDDGAAAWLWDAAKCQGFVVGFFL